MNHERKLVSLLVSFFIKNESLPFLSRWPGFLAYATINQSRHFLIFFNINHPNHEQERRADRRGHRRSHGAFFPLFPGERAKPSHRRFLLPEPARAWLWLMMPVFPVLAPACLWLASIIGKKLIFAFQLAKFLLVGAMATVFDLGSLAVFMAMTGIKEGAWYVVFKSASFIISVALKYFPNKLWAFKKPVLSIKKGIFAIFFPSPLPTSL